MAQATYTPISLYHSTTATTVPSSVNLVSGELALNIANADMSVYTKNNPAALKYPTADGTANQIIKTDGAGNLSFVAAGATKGQAIAFSLIFGL